MTEPTRSAEAIAAELEQQALDWEPVSDGPGDCFNDLVALLREAAALLRAGATLQVVGECRNGGPHYCPNCDNSFTALRAGAERREPDLRQQIEGLAQSVDYCGTSAREGYLMALGDVLKLLPAERPAQERR
jgi:hypothetical protein